jgi:hypothetical protein
MLELIRFIAESAGWKVQMDRFQEPVKSGEVTKQLSN